VFDEYTKKQWNILIEHDFLGLRPRANTIALGQITVPILNINENFDQSGSWLVYPMKTCVFLAYTNALVLWWPLELYMLCWIIVGDAGDGDVDLWSYGEWVIAGAYVNPEGMWPL